MPTAHQMPVRSETAQKVGPRMFRKTIMRPGHISKGGVDYDIDRPFMQQLVTNFTAGLRESVTLQLADRLNRHNEDPTRTRGKLAGLELTAADELVGIFETSADGAALLDTYPYIGCSPAIDMQFSRADGRAAGPTLLHVAATTDPEVSKLGDWLALSSEYDQVIDLTTPAEAPQSPATPGGSTQQEGPTVPELKTSDEETLAQLRALLPALTKLAAIPDDKTKTDDEGSDDEFTEAELKAMATPVVPAKAKAGAKPAAKEEAKAEEKVDEPELVAASHETSEALELANARIDAQQVELARMRRERDDERYAAEVMSLAKDFAVPREVTELAKPLLYGSGHTLELSAGKQIDAGQIVRKCLKEMGTRLMVHLDLGHEYGTADAEDDATKRKTDLDDFVTRARAELGH